MRLCLQGKSEATTHEVSRSWLPKHALNKHKTNRRASTDGGKPIDMLAQTGGGGTHEASVQHKEPQVAKECGAQDKNVFPRQEHTN